jgi:hypothetical protein
MAGVNPDCLPILAAWQGCGYPSTPPRSRLVPIKALPALLSPASAVMASFQGTTEVVSALPHIPVPIFQRLQVASVAQDVSDNLRIIHSLFAAPDTHNDGRARAQKRRKLDNGNVSVTQSLKFEEDKSIILARVSLDLVSSRATLHRRLS